MEVTSQTGFASVPMDYLGLAIAGLAALLAAWLALVLMFRVARRRKGVVVGLTWVTSALLLLPLSAGLASVVAIPFWIMALRGSNDPQAGMGAGYAMIVSGSILTLIIAAILTSVAATRGRRKGEVP